MRTKTYVTVQTTARRNSVVGIIMGWTIQGSIPSSTNEYIHTFASATRLNGSHKESFNFTSTYMVLIWTNFVFMFESWTKQLKTIRRLCDFHSKLLRWSKGVVVLTHLTAKTYGGAKNNSMHY
jgi:hypothetical protein